MATADDERTALVALLGPGAEALDLSDDPAEVDDAGWRSRLGSGPHRAVLLGDRLERETPAGVLTTLGGPGVLADDATLVLTLRDASHPAVVAELRDGRRVADGVLAETPRTWFTLSTLRHTLEAHGFVVDRAVGIDPPSGPEARPRRYLVSARRSGSAGELAAVRTRAADLEGEVARLGAELARARALLVEERAGFDEQLDHGRYEMLALRRRNKDLRNQAEGARTRRDQMRERRDQLLAQRDRLKDQRDEARKQRDRAQGRARQLQADLDSYAGSRWVRANRRVVGRLRRLRDGDR